MRAGEAKQRWRAGENPLLERNQVKCFSSVRPSVPPSVHRVRRWPAGPVGCPGVPSSVPTPPHPTPPHLTSPHLTSPHFTPPTTSLSPEGWPYRCRQMCRMRSTPHRKQMFCRILRCSEQNQRKKDGSSLGEGAASRNTGWRGRGEPLVPWHGRCVTGVVGIAGALAA